MLSLKKWKPLKITGLVWLICLSLETAYGAIRKDQNIQTPIGENTFISWGDINQLNLKLNAAFIAILAWFLMEAWNSYKKSKDKTGEHIEQLIKAVQRIEARLESFPTHVEMNEKIRDEIKYSFELKSHK